MIKLRSIYNEIKLFGKITPEMVWKEYQRIFRSEDGGLSIDHNVIPGYMDSIIIGVREYLDTLNDKQLLEIYKRLLNYKK